MSQISEIKETAVRLMSGILSNPNYNFENAKKAADIAVSHAQELVVKIAESVESGAEKVAAIADKVGDKARGADDKPKTIDPLTKAKVEQPKDPLAGI